MSWFGRKKGKDEETENEDLHEQLHRLEEQMQDLRRRLNEEGKIPHSEVPPRSPKMPRPPRPPKGVRIEVDGKEFHEDMSEFGRQMGELGDYIKMVVSDAMRGANKAMQSIFIGPDGGQINLDENGVSIGKSASEAVQRVPPEEAQRLLSPLASEERIRILYLLADEPRYHQDLMDLSGLKPGTLPHHLKQLEDAGYVTQERVRGRYLITIPGRMALKLAEYLHNQMISGMGDESE